MRRREPTTKNFFEGNITLSRLATSMNNVYKTISENGLAQGVEETLKGDIQLIADSFGISPKAAIMLPYIVEHNMTNGTDADDLAGFVGCSNIEFFGFRPQLEEMEKRGVIDRSNPRGGRSRYFLSREALKTIEKNDKFTPFPMQGLTADEFFTRFRIFFSDYQKDLIDAERLLDNIHQVIEDNPGLEFCRRVTQSGLNNCQDTDQRMFFYLCHRFVSFGDESVPVERLLNFTEFMEDDKLISRAIANEKTDIQRAGLVTFGGDKGFQDIDSLALSEEVVKTFFAGVTMDKHLADVQHPDLVPASSIVAKDLFYNTTETEQMERLAQLLDPVNFKGVQQRLQEMGMRKGFAVLFSGGAGCGKTAGVYELARRTGRDVFAVDMSQLKSKWVGDSEKIVKGVFDLYRTMCRKKENAPILLFNEADAIFSKRLENPRDSVDQMMNSIQNICLDAIENLDGILIATTNLAGNFCDDAFARRFIFKVEFSTPEAETRSKIWKSMVSTLSEEDAAQLGERYVFSGGNIENIARKSAVGYVLSGKKADMDDLFKYCDEEMLSSQKQTHRIGF